VSVSGTVFIFAQKLLTIVRNRIIISLSPISDLTICRQGESAWIIKTTEKKLYEYNNVLKSIDDCYRNIAKRYGFSEAAFWTLYTLRMEPGNITQSDVCTVLYQPKQTVNSALKKLESEGYITLTPAGAHTKNISLTKSGTKLCEQTVDKVIEAECAALGNMTDEETENMTALMKLYSILLKSQTAKI
jgi:DNA-binding MarR family transcriptional regulator